MSDIIALIDQYAKTELLILVPVLYIISKILATSKITNHRIPLIITVLSILLCGIYTFSTVPILNVHSALVALFVTLTQGILFAGGSILGGIISVCKTAAKPTTTPPTNPE